MDNSIIDIINTLRKDSFYGVGENVEIAKGKYQKINTWRQLKDKVKRIIKR